MIISLFIFLISSQAFGWSNPSGYKSSYIEVEESILAATIKGHFKSAKVQFSNDTKTKILADHENKVLKDFKIPKYFEDSVNFWFSIYTQYSSDQVVLHDSENLRLIYNVIDFSELKQNDSLHRFAKSQLQSQLSLEYTRRVKKVLSNIGKKLLRKLNEEESTILNDIKQAGIKVPNNRKARKKLMKQLALNLRTQTGQRNIILNGLVRVNPYLPFINKQLDNFGLPRELLAISFLESSFNFKARSKVDAAGAWQFMPYIGNLFMPRANKYVDYRFNPVVSTLAALHLLKENKMILKRWDLATPAYNSGPKHLKIALKKLSKKMPSDKIDLAYILENYEHDHIGFASKNFYAEFLALTRVLAYKNIIYPLEGIQIKKAFKDINVYLTKCTIRPQKYFNLLKKSSPYIKELNSHFKRTKFNLKRNSIVVSDIKLTDRKYYKLSDKEIKKRFPKNYFKYSKNKKCR